MGEINRKAKSEIGQKNNIKSNELGKQKAGSGGLKRRAINGIGIASALALGILSNTADAGPIPGSSSLATQGDYQRSNFNPVVTDYQSHSLDTPKASLSPFIESTISKIESKEDYQPWTGDNERTETLEPKSKVIQRLESLADCLEKSGVAQKVHENPDAMENINKLMTNKNFKECLASEIKNDASLKEAISLLETQDISSLLGNKNIMESIDHELKKRQNIDHPSEGLNKVELIAATIITGSAVLCAIGGVIRCLWKKKRQMNVVEQNNEIELQ